MVQAASGKQNKAKKQANNEVANSVHDSNENLPTIDQAKKLSKAQLQTTLLDSGMNFDGVKKLSKEELLERLAMHYNTAASKQDSKRKSLKQKANDGKLQECSSAIDKQRLPQVPLSLVPINESVIQQLKQGLVLLKGYHTTVQCPSRKPERKRFFALSQDEQFLIEKSKSASSL